MNRRNFVSGTVGLASLGLSSCTPSYPRRLKWAGAAPATLKAKRIEPGQTVALVCPGGPINQARLDKTLEAMHALGLKTKVGKHALAKNGFNAGSEAQRLSDLHIAYRDDEVDIVWAIRGGYGCTQLLSKLDFDLIGRTQKMLIGYSDITALLNAIYQQTGLVGFHGPVGSSSFDEFALQSISDVLFNASDARSYTALDYGSAYAPGVAEGILVGGNLSLVAAMCGTPYQINCQGKILLLEDVGEAPYRIDRMLVQLIQSMNLAGAAGIALGDFVDCEAKGGSASLSLEDTLRARLSGLGIPVYHALPFGHGRFNATLPIGSRAKLDANNGTLSLTERAVR